MPHQHYKPDWSLTYEVVPPMKGKSVALHIYESKEKARKALVRE